MPETPKPSPDQKSEAAKSVPEQSAKTAEKPKKRFDLRRGLETAGELASLGLAIDTMSGGKVTDTIRTMMMKAANLPLGNFTYSKELLSKVVEYSGVLKKDLEEAEQETDPKVKTRKELRLADRFKLYTDSLIQQFIQDNCSAATYTSFTSRRMERNKDAYHVAFLGEQLSILKELVSGNRGGAYQKARAHILGYVLGIGAPATPNEESIVDQLVNSSIAWIEEHMLPPLKEKILEFAQKGFLRQFADRAASTVEFFGDWVKTPFSEESKGKMSSMLEPLTFMGARKSFTSLVPIMLDICSLGWNVSVSKGMAAELLATCAGTVAFDGALLLASLGAGAGVNALKAAGMTGRAATTALEAANGARIAIGLGKSALRNPVTNLSSHLKFDTLLERVNIAKKKAADERVFAGTVTPGERTTG